MKHYENFIRRTTRRYCCGLVWLTLLALPALRADVTLRYKTEVTLNPRLPAQAVEQMTKGMNASLPASQTQQLKNGKFTSSMGNMTSIVDFNKREVTLVDSAGKRYSTVPADQYGEEIAKAMPKMPDAAQGPMASMKAHSESKATGRTEAIQGIEGEEHLISITIDAPAMPNVPPGPMMRMVMHVWTAKANEAARFPAVAELMHYDFRNLAGFDPMSMMAKTFEQMPGVADTFAAVMKEMKSAGSPVILRVQIEMYMPMVAALMARMPAGGDPSAAPIDADAPLTGIKYELAEVSTAPIADSVFQVPEGYQSVPVGDIMKDFVKERMAAAK